MPTRRGWALAVGAVVLAAAGRLLGIFELFVLAAGAAGLLVVGAGAVLVRRVDLEATRTLRPNRVHAGANTRVELAVRNARPAWPKRSGGRHLSPVVTVHDSFARDADSPSRHARLLLAPLRPGEDDTATYRLPAERRGIFTVGPLEADVSDAFGLWSRRFPIAPAVELTVYPAVEALQPLGHSRGDDPTAGSPRQAVGTSGEDLYGLRPYRMGDDLRRVHWASTARTGDLVVRQLEQPWQGRATVVLDVRAAVHTDASLEAAVSAAASIVTASWSGGALVRLITSDGTDSGFAAGHPHFEAVLEHLAVVEAGADGLAPVVAGLHRAGNGGALAVITTADAPATDLELLAGLHSRFDALTVVVVEGPRARRTAEAVTRTPGGVTTIRVAAGAGLAPCWNTVADRARAAGR